MNEIDHDPAGVALDRFAALLAGGVAGLPGLDYPYRFADQPNTGVPSGHDLDGDGRTMGPGDALGYGRFPGQYGMALLSRFPLGPARTFRTLPWSALPGAEPPRRPDGTPFWPDAVWRALPLSSKSHWDVTVRPSAGPPLHLLASHPTPPVFDGPEDRNGLRNAAEIGFWTAWLAGAALPDDSGGAAPLPAEAAVIVLGDLNLDPADGDGRRAAIRALLADPRLQDPRPASRGGKRRRRRAARMPRSGAIRRSIPPTGATTSATCASTTSCPPPGLRSPEPASSGRRPTTRWHASSPSRVASAPARTTGWSGSTSACRSDAGWRAGAWGSRTGPDASS